MGERDQPEVGAEWDAVWRFLAAELGTERAELLADGCRLVSSEPRPRPYFGEQDGHLLGFHRDGALTVAAAAGFVGFGRAWIHHFATAAEAAGPAGLRWLRQNLIRGGARVEVVDQYVLFAVDRGARLDPRIRRLTRRDAAWVETELGWSPDEARAAVGRGLYAAVVDDRIACEAQVWDLGDRLSELAVRTQPEFQGRGLATETARSALFELLAERTAVLYSVEPDNLASAAIADRLGAHFCGTRIYTVTERREPGSFHDEPFG